MIQIRKYRKKPVVIEAIQFTKDNGYEVVSWIRSNGYSANWNCFSNDDQSIDISTLEGVMTASLNDMIIKGIKNELYPCKPDIFSGSYEVE